MDYKNLLVEIGDGIAVVKVNRPAAMNALNAETLCELIAAFQALDGNDEVRVIILTGEGKAFVAGADIREMVPLTAAEARGFSGTGHALFAAMEKMEKPIIAAVNGFALGGGVELAMACDFIVASEKAKFGQPEINLGIIPGFGGTQRLPRLIGTARAKELIFTGDMIGGEEAKELGLVNRLFPAETLLDEAKKIAARIVSKGALSVRMAKKAINAGANVDLITGCEFERNAFGLCFSHEDQKEGMNAFLEKRQPSFTSR